MIEQKIHHNGINWSLEFRTICGIDVAVGVVGRRWGLGARWAEGEGGGQEVGAVGREWVRRAGVG